MTKPATFVPSGFFALRTPLLPRAVLSTFSAGLEASRVETKEAKDPELAGALERDRATLRARLRALVEDPVVREALFVASPSLDDAVTAWLTEPTRERARGVEEVLVRYLGRMTARCTPFGLFAGLSTSALSASRKTVLAERASYRRASRLDMHYLSALTEELGRDQELTWSLTHVPTTGLYRAPGQLRHYEGRPDPKTRALAYELLSLAETGPLTALLARAEGGARPAELVETLVSMGHREADATAYVTAVIQAQTLVSELEPPITGTPATKVLIETLGKSPAGRAHAEALREADAALGAIDASGIGGSTSRYRDVATTLTKLPVKAELARLFQVDLFKPLAEQGLPGSVLNEMRRIVGVLAQLTPRPPSGDALARFRSAFMERFESAWVPLADALDEESGIGFPSHGNETGDPAPLIDTLPFPNDPSPPVTPFGAREQHLVRRLGELTRSGAREWVLDSRDLKALSSDVPASLPEALAIMTTILGKSWDAVDKGDFRLTLDGVAGPSGATLLGRFCHGDPELSRHIREHIAAEEALHDDVIFAEVVHLAEGRLGNILGRPVLRGWEIPYHGRSGAPADRQLLISDLLVTVMGDRVVLRSKKLDRVVVPRLTNAHNWPAAKLEIYRFLCSLQAQGQTALGWSWGALESAPFLPRVREGKTILSSASWNLSREELEPLEKARGDERFALVARLRAARDLPRWIGVADADNVLPVDLDNVMFVESFVELVKGRASVRLIELPDEDDLVVEGPEGRFDNEVIVPFVLERAPLEAGAADITADAPRARAATPVVRKFAPGSEWLYLKVYSGTVTADSLLSDFVAPVLEEGRASGAIESWFFIRYADPATHLRVRFRGSPERLLGETLPAVHQAIAPYLENGSAWKLQLDTYHREVERYGGPNGIELCEQIFEADSDTVLALVQALEDDDDRWRLTLRGLHLLLVDLGLDLEGRRSLLRALRTDFAAEHHVGVGDPNKPSPESSWFEQALSQQSRKERSAVDALLRAPVGGDHPLDHAFSILATRSTKIAPFAEELRKRAESGDLSMSLPDIAASLLHMHANRFLRARQRAQELVLYDALLRFYDSEAARQRSR
ncbi:MAG: lantibiotic dehydratase [Labilithrix sp.]|nr:lantibiotic dehydratase [Labilithrix sp.]MCW5809952.1 lantibiotic dehydratase [Labilithrix sp.]